MNFTLRTRLQGALAAAGTERFASTADVRAQAPTLHAIPSTGERLPVIGIGANAYNAQSRPDMEARRAVLREFPDQGGRVVDTARGYGRSEAVIGRLLGELAIRGSRAVPAAAASSRSSPASRSLTRLPGSWRACSARHHSSTRQSCHWERELYPISPFFFELQLDGEPADSGARAGRHCVGCGQARAVHAVASRCGGFGRRAGAARYRKLITSGIRR